jgi:hypothetical protein
MVRPTIRPIRRPLMAPVITRRRFIERRPLMAPVIQRRRLDKPAGVFAPAAADPTILQLARFLAKTAYAFLPVTGPISNTRGRHWAALSIGFRSASGPRLRRAGAVLLTRSSKNFRPSPPPLQPLAYAPAEARPLG